MNELNEPWENKFTATEKIESEGEEKWKKVKLHTSGVYVEIITKEEEEEEEGEKKENLLFVNKVITRIVPCV